MLRNSNILSYEQLGSCTEVKEAHTCKKAWDVHKNIFKVKGAYVQTCVKNLTTTEQNNSRESCRISVIW